MLLKEKKYFYFTQNSLQTFTDCPFKFRKKYIDNVKWEVSDEISSRASLGTDFHKIAQRYFMKIPVYEESFKDNEHLYSAYNNLMKRFPLDDTSQFFSEYSIRISNDFIRIEANIDLLIVHSTGEIEIWDFKTGAERGKAKKFEESLQTAVYMYAVAKTSENFFDNATPCNKIKMAYYNPEKDIDIVTINYSEEKFKTEEKNIAKIIEKIYNYDYRKFDRKNHLQNCKFCEFSLFCDNQKSEAENELSFAVDWNAIEEIR